MNPRLFRFLPALLLAFAACPLQAKDWEILADCKLKNAMGNDGDSFHVLHGGKEHIFRLYFVDTPETSSDFPDRVKEQAGYFRITPDQALRLGREAESFTRKFLKEGTFTVYTCWEDAKGDSALPADPGGPAFQGPGGHGPGAGHRPRDSGKMEGPGALPGLSCSRILRRWMRLPVAASLREVLPVLKHPPGHGTACRGHNKENPAKRSLEGLKNKG